MSVWKKASKTNQRTHRERHQPAERESLGLLEKKSDYQRRAQDYNAKKETLKTLRKRALNKNPDEFYHHMINAKTEDGRHFEKETEAEDSPQQVSLMRTQDLKYITAKRTQETKKIEKLQSSLHMTSVSHTVKNQHIRFGKKIKKEPEDTKTPQSNVSQLDLEVLKDAAKKKKHLYGELLKRINRERELSVVQRKIELKRVIEGKKTVLPPKRLKKGTKDRAPVYVWKYERKK